MLGLAALILAAASTNSTPAFASAEPWWEKITYTLSNDGLQHRCEYESSLAAIESCDEDGSVAPSSAAGTPGAYTKITFERRFTPGEPVPVSLQSGDVLLGGQIMALAIDGSGLVRSCRVVAMSGDLEPDYGCDEVRAERFGPDAIKAGSKVHEGHMTILVYGHEEQIA